MPNTEIGQKGMFLLQVWPVEPVTRLPEKSQSLPRI